jgi:hypothetical protein
LKSLLDAVFNFRNYRNEIVWKRTHSHGSAQKWGDVHDIIFLYTKTASYTWNKIIQAYDESYVEGKYRFNDTRGQFRLVVLTAPGTTKGDSGRAWRGYDPTTAGRHWAVPQRAIEALRGEGVEIPEHLHDQLELLYDHNYIRFPEKKGGKAGVPEFKLYLGSGAPIQDVITNIPPINSQAKERLGYPTQKPVALLERIIQASSNPGDIVVDPFCGCGTTIHAAQKLDRQWAGIDITHLAISLIEKRLGDAFPGITFDLHGTPKDLEGARALAAQDKYQFQWWAVSLVNAVPYGGKKKGADSGIDGHVYFKPDGRTTEKAIVSVKGGDNVSVAMVRDLAHVVDREKAKIGVFITLAEPTAPMKTEAVKTGYYETEFGKYPKIQILTIKELFEGKKPAIPLVDPTAFRRAEAEPRGKQDRLI